jgi:hypothetical protein
MRTYHHGSKHLKRTRPIKALEKDAYAPIAVVGGGIAGVEAFFSLWILFHL